MRRVDKVRAYVAMVATSAVMGFIIDTPVEFITYMAVASAVVAFIVNTPTRQQRRADY
jgi:hypothetical protein